MESQHRMQLVDRVKSLCRTDPAAKQAWCSWCDAAQGGTKDPGRMDEATLQSFFDAFESGSVRAGITLPTETRGGPAKLVRLPTAAPEQPQIAEAVKLGQRVSPSWKAAWARFCEVHGNGVYDPAKHQKDFLQSFFELLGSQGGAALGVGLEEDMQGLPSTAEEAAEVEQPPQPELLQPPLAKRLCTGQPATEGGGGCGGGCTPIGERQAPAGWTKSQLAQMVKDMQKTDPNRKVLWSEYCDQYGGGVKDPSRHTPSSLEKFFALAELSL